MCDERYTQEQIFSGIRIVWREELGCESPFDLDTRLDEQLKAEGLFDELDFIEVIRPLQRLFGFACPMNEWELFLGCHIHDPEEWERNIAPRLTFRALADFIRQRLNPISLNPVTLLGKPCLTAGIFRGLEQLAEQINPKVTRFAPSTAIRDRLRGLRLHCFWSRLRWILQDQLPPPPRITLTARGFLHSLVFKFGVGLLVALCKRDLSGVLAGIVTTFALFIPMGVILAFINSRMNPLPEGIETFGDLSRVLAAIILDQQSEAASCSTP